MLDLGVPIEQVNYLAGHKSMAMTKRYDHANEERYGGAIEALDEALNQYPVEARNTRRKNCCLWQEYRRAQISLGWLLNFL